MQRHFMTPALNLATAMAAAGSAGAPPRSDCKSIRYAHIARTISGTFQSQKGLGRAFSCVHIGHRENEGCGWSKTVMRIIEGIHAHQLSK